MQTGEILGGRVYVQDDGGVVDRPLALKVPDVAKEWVCRAEAAEAELRRLKAQDKAPDGQQDDDWFWKIVDKDGPQGLPSDERAALRILVNHYRKAPAVTMPGRDAVIQECADKIRADCEACGGTGHGEQNPLNDPHECEYCGRPRAAILALWNGRA